MGVFALPKLLLPNFEAKLRNQMHNFVKGKFNLNFVRLLRIVPEKWSQVHPDSAFFQNFVYAFQIFTNIVGCIDKKASNYTIPGI